MRTANLSTWLLRGTYPRLYVPIILIILLVSAVRYHYLLAAEIEEARRQGTAELRRAGDVVLPALADLPPSDAQAATATLRNALAQLGPGVAALEWQVPGQPPAQASAPVATVDAPGWFVRWVAIDAPVQQFGHAVQGGATGRLTVTLQRAPLVQQVWKTVVVQLRISALNIFTILFLLTLLLRANARMLQRLAAATNAFRHGRLDTRMEVAGTLESRALAETFNDMAGKVQSLVLSLRETQHLQSEQLHFTRQLIDALPLPVFVRDPEGAYLEVNRAWQRLFHPPSTPGGGHHPTPVYPEELSPERSAQIAQGLDNEIRIRPANRQPARDMAYYEAPFTTTRGTIAGTIGTLVDVTERKRAEEALRAEKERAEVTLASIGDGVITTTLDGCIDSLNEAAQLMTGFTAEQAVGHQLDDVFRLDEGLASRAVRAAAERDSPARTLQQVTQEVLLHRSGERYAIEYTASAIRKADGTAVGCVLVFRDVTDTRNLRQQASWHARHDALTGLYNRTALAERLTQAVFEARQNNTLLAVCLLDLDHFEAVNRAHGNRVGDRLLKEAARRLGAFVQGSRHDTVARMGGDEFVLLLGGLADRSAAEARLETLLRHLAVPYAIDDRVIQGAVSVGVALFPQDDATPDTLLRHADQAVCRAKVAGRNRVHVFDPQQDHAVQTAHTRQTRVARALGAGELVLHYQPRVHLGTGEVLGLEALLRWQHPEDGLLEPQELLAQIEDAELQAELGEWVLRQALAQMRQWTDAGMLWSLGVNIAAAHVHRSGFAERLKDILHASPEVAPERLELEIVESAALQDLPSLQRTVRSCQALGVRIALDDFGTGLSSLSHLQRLPADTIKIDPVFVHGVAHDADSRAMVAALVAVAAAFGRRVVAEGVETEDQAERLLALGCEQGQGYGIARPLPAHEVVGWAREHAARHAARAVQEAARRPAAAPPPGHSR